jgi:hypothetical protein
MELVRGDFRDHALGGDAFGGCVSVLYIALDGPAKLNFAHHEMLTTVFGFSRDIYTCRCGGARAAA